MPDAPQGFAGRARSLAASAGISSEILLRDALRGARRWQTHAVRVLFTGVLLGGVLSALHLAVTASRTGAVDVADLSWLGRGLFVAFAVLQLSLATLLAPLSASSAVIDETGEGTLDLLVLTPLSPGRIYGGLVLARLLTLATVVAGALPVLTLLVSLGGMSTVEVVAVTVHTLTALGILGLVGALFGLFTRSPMLATAMSAAYAVPAFWLLPSAYAATVGSPWAAARFSVFLGPAAHDITALLPPLSMLPAALLIFTIGRRLFALRVAGAPITRAFDGDTWRLGTWTTVTLALIGVGVPLIPVATAGAWSVNLATIPPTGLQRAAGVAAEIALWAWFSAAAWSGTWIYLRLGADLVFTLDNLLTRRGPGGTRRAARVWANPVAWREARPRTWGSVAMPILVTWTIVTLVLLQSFSWLIPGGILFLGGWTASAAFAVTVWVATHAIESERRWGTLPVLLTTTTPPWRIALGKVLGVAVPALPLLMLALPLLVVGYLHAWPWMTDPTVAGLLARGLGAWVWLMLAWLITCFVAMLVALRVDRPGAAFGATLGGGVLVVGIPALVARLLPDQALLALPGRLLAPPLAGGAGWGEHLLAVGLAAGLVAVSGRVLVVRLRRWGGVLVALLCLAPAIARAGDPVELAGLTLQAEAVGDGWVRPHRTATVHLTIHNAGRATTGTLALVERHGDGLESVSWEREVELPEGALRRVQLRYLPAEHARPRGLTLTTRDRRAVAVEVPAEPVPEDAVLIGVLGDDHLGMTGLRDTWTGAVPGRVPRVDTPEPRPVRVGTIPVAAAPDHAAGYDAFDWIVWPDPDPSRLAPAQLDALLHAVAGGGHLLLTVADGWRLLDGPLGDALPVDLAAPRVLDRDVAALLALDSPTMPPARPFVQARVRHAPNRRSWTLADDLDGPVWVAGTFGLGTVHVLLADPADPALRSLGSALWRRLLLLPVPELSPHDPWTEPSVPRALSQALWQRSPYALPSCVLAPGPNHARRHAERHEAELRAHLSDIPGVAPLPLGWLIALSGAYLLIIGPLDFLALRAIGRPGLTWLTFPVVIVVFSGIALVGTARTKGSQAVATRLEVVDWLPGTVAWRGHGWIGVFATRKAALSVDNGFSDGTLAPLAARGFMTEPSVRSTDGPTSLTYRAETWTLAYTHSRWTEDLGPGPTLRETAAGYTLEATLPFDLRDAWLVRGDDDGPTWVPLGELRRGDLVALRLERGGRLPHFDDDDAIAGKLVEIAELGHLHVEAHGWVLIGLTGPVEPLRLRGLEPDERALTLVRVPLTPQPAEEPP